MCILDLGKASMYKFHYNYIKKINMETAQDYYSQVRIVWCTKLKLKMYLKILGRLKRCLILAIILLSHNIMAIKTNKLVVGKMKDETIGVAINEFLRLKPKMY